MTYQVFAIAAHQDGGKTDSIGKKGDGGSLA